METTELFLRNYNSKADVVINQGGAWSGKTTSILETLFIKLGEEPGARATVVGQSIPNLRKGPIRDSHDIIARNPELAALVRNYNKSSRVFTLHNEAILEFTSYLTPQDAQQGKRRFLFANEANGISFEIWEQLFLRSDKCWVDYNPSSEFWVHEQLMKDPSVNWELLISDHRHNPYVPERTREKLEALKHRDMNLWKVYARGRTGKVEGLVFQNWDAFVPGPDQATDDTTGIPTGARWIGYGMDFGFTNDPTTLVGMWSIGDDQLLIKEYLYRTGMTGADINRELRDLKIDRRDEIYGDCADPRLIKELSQMGWNIKPSIKGPDSKAIGIDTLKRYKMLVMPGSPNMTKELRAYRWMTDKDGKPLNKPVEFMDHTIDPLRYIAASKLRKPKREGAHYAMD